MLGTSHIGAKSHAGFSNQHHHCPSSDQKLREAFDLFDHDGDGRITSSELRTVMEILRLEASDTQIREMINKVDIDGNGTIEFDEFTIMMARRVCTAIGDELQRQREEEEIKQAFKVFDIDGDGLIDDRELRLTMTNLGERLSDDDVKAMIVAADQNGDGKIDYHEFVRMMYSKHDPQL